MKSFQKSDGSLSRSSESVDYVFEFTGSIEGVSITSEDECAFYECTGPEIHSGEFYGFVLEDAALDDFE